MTNYFFLQAPSAGPMGGMSTLIFMGMIMLVFWLFFIRPQSKKQKQQQLFISDLKKGDKVVTAAGIHGKINRLNDDGTIELEISPGSYIKMEKSYINMEASQLLNKPAAVPAVTEKK